MTEQKRIPVTLDETIELLDVVGNDMPSSTFKDLLNFIEKLKYRENKKGRDSRLGTHSS